MITRSPLGPLRKSIYQRLTANNITGGVFDFVPDNQPFPYTAIGEDTDGDQSTKDIPGSDVTVTMHCYSRYAGASEINAMIDAVLQSLTKTPLDLTADGFALVWLRKDFVNSYKEDSITRHAVVRVRATVSQTN